MPQFPAGPLVFQVQTSVQVQLPAATATFRAGGRTGPATVTFCAGQTATIAMGVNPACVSPAARPSRRRGWC